MKVLKHKRNIFNFRLQIHNTGFTKQKMSTEEGRGPKERTSNPFNRSINEHLQTSQIPKEQIFTFFKQTEQIKKLDANTNFCKRVTGQI